MKGHVRKKDNGWQYTIELGRDPDGKRKQRSKQGFKTKKECEAAMHEMISKIEKGEYIEYKDMSVEQFMEKWLGDKKKKIKITTYQFYEKISRTRVVPILGKVLLNKLKPLDIKSFLDKCYEDETINDTTIKHYYITLKTALNQAVKWQLIQVNPCNAIESPRRVKNEMKVLSQEQVNKLLEYTQQSQFDVMYMPLILALTCGLRRGEIVALTWDKVDLEKGYIRVNESVAVRLQGENIVTSTKTDAGERTVTLIPSTIPLLKEYKKNQFKVADDYEGEYKDAHLVCCWPDGSSLRPDYLSKTLKKLLKKCDLPHVRFHDLRHTHATFLLQQNVNAKVVSNRLGHANIDITLDLYSHVTAEMQQEAAEKLDNIFALKQVK